jgi:hypothetical protein
MNAMSRIASRESLFPETYANAAADIAETIVEARFAAASACAMTPAWRPGSVKSRLDW